MAGELVIISAGHALHALDTISGREIWRVAADDLLTSAPTFAGGAFYLGGWDGTI